MAQTFNTHLAGRVEDVKEWRDWLIDQHHSFVENPPRTAADVLRFVEEELSPPAAVFSAIVNTGYISSEEIFDDLIGKHGERIRTLPLPMLVADLLEKLASNLTAGILAAEKDLAGGKPNPVVDEVELPEPETICQETIEATESETEPEESALADVAEEIPAEDRGPLIYRKDYAAAVGVCDETLRVRIEDLKLIRFKKAKENSRKLRLSITDLCHTFDLSHQELKNKLSEVSLSRSDKALAKGHSRS